jgi:hypothetical protein
MNTAKKTKNKARTLTSPEADRLKSHYLAIPVRTVSLMLPVSPGEVLRHPNFKNGVSSCCGAVIEDVDKSTAICGGGRTATTTTNETMKNAVVASGHDGIWSGRRLMGAFRKMGDGMVIRG